MRDAIRQLPGSKIREVANAGLGREDVLAYWFGEGDEPTPAFIREAAAASLARGETFYSHNLGLPELRAAIATWLERRFALPAGSVRPADMVLPVNGTREGLFAFVQAAVDSGKPAPALEDGALDDHEGRGPLLTSMQRETDRLIRLVNELLVLTRADAGSLQLELQPLDLCELVKQRSDVLSNLATGQGINFNVVDETNQDTLVLADPDRLSQILDNLLDNAIRHSHKDSTINIVIKEEIYGISCSLCVDGDGIPPEHLPFIFERFYRVDKSRDRNRGGTGLGLAITRALVRAQGGTITAQSVGQCRGPRGQPVAATCAGPGRGRLRPGTRLGRAHRRGNAGRRGPHAGTAR